MDVTISSPGVFGDPPQRVLMLKSNNTCISTTNSAVTIGNPNTTTTSGPFTLQLDMATGRFIAVIGTSFPDNQCRTLTFNNFPLGLKLAPHAMSADPAGHFLHLSLSKQDEGCLPELTSARRAPRRLGARRALC
jgi:hypothetical protein